MAQKCYVAYINFFSESPNNNYYVLLIHNMFFSVLKHISYEKEKRKGKERWGRGRGQKRTEGDRQTGKEYKTKPDSEL